MLNMKYNDNFDINNDVDKIEVIDGTTVYYFSYELSKKYYYNLNIRDIVNIMVDYPKFQIILKFNSRDEISKSDDIYNHVRNIIIQ